MADMTMQRLLDGIAQHPRRVQRNPMADMSLQQVRDGLRMHASDKHATLSGLVVSMRHMADAIDAHLAGTGEPAAYFIETSPGNWEQADSSYSNDSDVFPFYTAPPASGDWDAVRDVIDALEDDGDELGCAAMLRAALPESKS